MEGSITATKLGTTPMKEMRKFHISELTYSGIKSCISCCITPLTLFAPTKRWVSCGKMSWLGFHSRGTGIWCKRAWSAGIAQGLRRDCAADCV